MTVQSKKQKSKFLKDEGHIFLQPRVDFRDKESYIMGKNLSQTNMTKKMCLAYYPWDILI